MSEYGPFSLDRSRKRLYKNIMNMIGFSTGCLYKSSWNIFEVIEGISAIETEAIELNFGRVEELTQLSEADIQLLARTTRVFRNVSIHAPFRKILYDKSTSNLLERIVKMALSIHSNYVVFHPDTIGSFGLIEQKLGTQAAIENMDKDKKIGQKVIDLERIFKRMPSSQFVLDLNHVFTVDPTMSLAVDFFETFRSRLASCHLSGYGGEEALHTSFAVIPDKTILNSVPDRNVLAIHEGVFDNFQEMKEEYSSLANLLD